MGFAHYEGNHFCAGEATWGESWPPWWLLDAVIQVGIIPALKIPR